MPIVAAPVLLMALGAMICYLLAQPMTRALFTSAAESVPVVGKYLARGVIAIEQGMIDLFKHYVWASTVTFVHWVVGLATNLADFPREVRLFAAGVADALDHAMTTTVHDIVKAFVNPVRDTANAAKTAADNVAADLNKLSGGLSGRITVAVGAGIAGIWSTVHNIANAAGDDAIRLSTAYADDVAGHAAGIAEGIGDDVRDLTDALGDLVNPRVVAETIAGAAAAVGVEALVETQVMPLVRDLTECSPKLRATCQTDMSEWLGLLEGLVLVGGIPSLIELARAAQGAVGDFADDAASVAGIPGAASVPSHPSEWV